jgi:GTP-binding protein
VMAEEYLDNRRELALSIQLIDARHPPTELDRQLNEWLNFHRKNHIIVATKADKLSSNKLQKCLLEITNALPESKFWLIHP